MPDLTISRLGLMAKTHNPLALKAVERINKWGGEKGVEILADRDTATLAKREGLDREPLLKAIDALIVLGGDGTLLSAARMATNKSLPLLGVNLGSLGFITEVALDEIETALDELMAGDYVIEERMMIDLTKENDKQSIKKAALNDIVFSRRLLAKMIELSIKINGQHVNSYKADGLVISTPTGSTAYALSTGGPILYPLMDSLVICPICPHTLTNRPIVIPGDSVIELNIREGQEEIIATLDGQVCIDVNERDRLIISRSDNVTQLIKVPKRTHYDTLRSKLGWG
jgi:NAD+ kinase